MKTTKLILAAAFCAALSADAAVVRKLPAEFVVEGLLLDNTLGCNK